MPRTAALRLLGALIVGLALSLGSFVAGAPFYIATRGGQGDVPAAVMAAPILLGAASLWKRSLIIFVLLHLPCAFLMFAASVTLAFEGRVPIPHTIMVAVMIAIPAHVWKWRHCFEEAW